MPLIQAQLDGYYRSSIHGLLSVRSMSSWTPPQT
jgi:hypothetical protein